MRPLLVLTLVVAAACSDASGPPPGDVEDPVTVTITVENNSGTTLDRVYFKTCGVASWGNTRLEPGEVILAAATRSWTVDAGCFDLRTVTVSGVARQFFDVTIEAGQTRVFRIT